MSTKKGLNKIQVNSCNYQLNIKNLLLNRNKNGVFNKL